MSIRFKLSLWLTALVIITTLVGMIIFESMLRDAFHDSIINRLEEDLEQVLLATQFDHGEISVDQTEISPFYKPIYSGRYFQLNLSHDIIRSPSLWDQDLAIELLKPGKTHSWQAKGPNNHDIQLLSIGLGSPVTGKTATLTVAQDLSIGRSIFSEINSTKLLVNIVMLLFMIACIFILLRRSFKPINEIKSSLIKLQNGEITALAIQKIPSEIVPLAQTFNELLDYTAKQVERSRNNLGNLSHGLKTPLAVMQQQVEVLGLNHPEIAESLQQQLDLIHKMVERKLTAARITGNMLPAAQFILPRDVESLIQTLTKIHAHKSIQFTIALCEPHIHLPIHREDGMELLGNLLDNAYKWAKTRVNLTLTLENNHFILNVEDDGPGVAKNELKLLTERGTRLDESVMGHGLGLSIVKEITEQYNITLNFNASDSLQGLKITLKFND